MNQFLYLDIELKLRLNIWLWIDIMMLIWPTIMGRVLSQSESKQ
jgi:hypothetical protein